MANRITDTSKVVVAANQVSSNLAGEQVILQIESGMYFGLESVGARIWELIQQPRVFSDICRTISEEYHVDLAVSTADTRQFMMTMLEARLIEIIPE